MNSFTGLNKTSLKFVRSPAQLVLTALRLERILQVLAERRNFMTANQINYARQQEDKRHNLRSENQKDRDLAIGERQAAASELQASTAARRQSEDARHNLQTEAVNWFSAQGQLQETTRHNKELESINWFDTRSQAEYRSAEAVSSRIRAQAASTSASASMLGSQAALQQAAVASVNAATRQSELAESIRHNQQQEAIGFEQATAASVSASAASTQADVSKSKASSEKFRNYASGVGSAASGIGSLASSILKGGFFK